MTTDEQTAAPARPPATAPRSLRAIGTGMSIVAGVGTVLLMLLTVVDVTLRQLGGRGVGFTLEVTEVVLVAVVFAGMASAQLSRSHVQTPILTDHLPPRWADAARFAGLVVAVALMTWLTVMTLRSGLTSLRAGEFRFGLVRFPVWPAKLVIPVGAAGFTLVLLSDCVSAGRALVRGRPAPAATEGEPRDGH